MPFYILSLTGGGYRGLFTAEILAKLEERAGRPIWECFDLIAGTSIGGIIAIGLAMGKTAKQIKEEFIARGEMIFPPEPLKKGRLKKFLELKARLDKPKYDGSALRAAVDEIVGKNVLRDARTRLLIPAVNMTSGTVQMFKTPHDPKVLDDQFLLAADVAMATSAAPFIFPLAKIKNSYFADGGLAANAPDACAIHEAIHYAGQHSQDIRVLSIGTTITNFGLPTSLGSEFGIKQWLTNQRLLNTVFCVQQQLVDFMVSHNLKERYLRIDEVPSTEHGSDIGLDLATKHSRETLQGLAQQAFKKIVNQSLIAELLRHKPSQETLSWIKS